MRVEKQRRLQQLELRENEVLIEQIPIDTRIRGLPGRRTQRSLRLIEHAFRRRHQLVRAAELALYAEVSGRGALEHRVAEHATEEQERPLPVLCDLRNEGLHHRAITLSDVAES